MPRTTPTTTGPERNEFLRDILAQPPALALTLDHLLSAQRTEIARAAALLSAADRIVLTSMGSAYHSLGPAADVLGRRHPNVHLVESATLLRGDPHARCTTYVVMSRSGESREIAELSGRLRGVAPVIAITMTPDSTLAANSTVVIHDPAPFDALICTKAYTSLVLTGLLLTSHLEGAVTGDLVRSLYATFQRMDEDKDALLGVLSAIPWIGAPVTFLSRGVGTCTAAAGALWLAEAARVGTAHFSAEAFLHGPVEQVDEGFCGMWIDLEPDAAGEAHHRALRAKGARLLSAVLDPGYPGYPGDVGLAGADLPAPYRTIPGALPAQLLSYVAAVRRGLEPGALRYVNWVVR